MKILDHGYLELVENWGSDQTVIEAARMSTDKGFLGWGPVHTTQCNVGFRDGQPCSCTPKPGDEKLLRYLWEHEHSTPFEFGGLTIEVQAPIAVFREWHRHRVPFGYCLAGDTEITCIGSGGLTRHYTIEHIYRMKHEGVLDHHPERPPLPSVRVANGYSRSGAAVTRKRRSRGQSEQWRVRKLPSCQQRTLRVLDEASEMYTTAAMQDVWQSGMKEVWLVETVKGHTIKASADHLFYTREGWKKLSELRAGDRLATNGLVAAMERPIPPALRSGIAVWSNMMRSRLIADRDTCCVCGREFDFNDLELDHVVAVSTDLRLALDESNLKPTCKRCHRAKSSTEQKHRQGQTRLGLRWIDIARKPVRVGEEMAYDISVEGAHHNFVANGLVVHNSELSARYTPMPDLNYVPDAANVVERARAAQMSKNRQAQGHVAYDLTMPDVENWLSKLEWVYRQCEDVYKEGLNAGIPKELARLCVPVGRYSRMRATGNLRGWLNFCRLRCAPQAQWEIRQYANAVLEMLREKFPRTVALYEEGGVKRWEQEQAVATVKKLQQYLQTELANPEGSRAITFYALIQMLETS